VGKFKDITGQKFGRLTVIERLENDKWKQARWKCLCECGNYIICITRDLKKGSVKSCGCLHKEIIKKVNTKHGLKKTRLYRLWNTIKRRCYNKSFEKYKNYGGRGITMCDEWKNDFKSFHDWAYANGYDENTKRGDCTIDRIDVNGNYEPNNCRWATNKEQQRNRSNNHFITYEGKTHCISEWAEILDIKPSYLYQKLKKDNFDIKKLLSCRG
jgi:hypothetical protein